MSFPSWAEWLADAAESRKDAGLDRSLKIVKRQDARAIEINGREHLSFLSNDYLNLASHPKIIAAVSEAVSLYGVGASASRLISGTTPLHAALEAELAGFLRAPSALCFTSGYHANLGVISSLADANTLILSDSLNHASIIDGARLSKARVAVFPHRDYDTLRDMLVGSKEKRFLIISDGLFSIDGDLCDWVALNNLAQEFGALLMVDDAHSFGVLGENGRGSFEAAGITLDDHILLSGTFSKAAGALGGFVATSIPIRDHLVNHARSLIFSTAGDVAALAASRAALEIIQSEEGRIRREHTLGLAQTLRKDLKSRGLESGGEAQIVPLWLGRPESAVELAKLLSERGIAAAAIRPPTVPKGRSMLRFSINASHSGEDIDSLLNALASIT